MGTRYKVGDKVAVFGSYAKEKKLVHFLRGVGVVKEIRGNPRFYERRFYIIQLPDRVRMCVAGELRLIQRKP